MDGAAENFIKAAKEAEELWHTYILYNDTLEEVYVGTVKRKDLPGGLVQSMEQSVLERVKQCHAQGETKTIAHWDFQNEPVRVWFNESGMTEEDSRQYAHSLEKSTSSINNILNLWSKSIRAEPPQYTPGSSSQDGFVTVFQTGGQ